MYRIWKHYRCIVFVCIFILSTSYCMFYLNQTKTRGVLEYSEYDENIEQDLTQILNVKIQAAKTANVIEVKSKPTCDTEATISNSCNDGKCLRTEISENPRERLSQLVGSKKLQLTPDVLSTLEHMGKKIMGFYDVILVTAASSNHFLESQAMIKGLHEIIFPSLNNYTLVYYDIGLTEEERILLGKHCKCTVVDFPFEKFPEFIKDLKCYSWKPLIIKAHIHNGNSLVWLDSSVRFEDSEGFNALVRLAKERGLQLSGPTEISPFRTVRSMYHFFGDEPCAYIQMRQVTAGLGFYKRDPFVNRVILEPWVACALNKKCICPTDIKQKTFKNIAMLRKWRRKGGPITYGLLHRYDQSAVSLILHKVFHRFYQYALFRQPDYNVTFRRNDKINYFSATHHTITKKKR